MREGYKSRNKYIEMLLNDPNIDVRIDGTIWAFSNRNGIGIPTKWRRIDKVDKLGYHFVGYTCKPGSRKNRMTINLPTHRIIYAKFNGPLEENLVINHKDGIKNNNLPSNLELITSGENASHAFKVLGYSPIKHSVISFEIANTIRELSKNGKKL